MKLSPQPAEELITKKPYPVPEPEPEHSLPPKHGEHSTPEAEAEAEFITVLDNDICKCFE